MRKFYVYPEWFREARLIAGYSIPRCAAELGVTPRTIYFWEAGACRVPCSAFRLLRLLGCYALPGRAWEGWSIKGDTLWSPESKAFRAVDFAWWGLTVAMARAFKHQHAADLQPNDVLLQVTLRSRDFDSMPFSAKQSGLSDRAERGGVSTPALSSVGVSHCEIMKEGNRGRAAGAAPVFP